MQIESEKPESEFFSFEKPLSENEITQSWRATEVKTGTPCFVKISKTGALGHNEASSILDKSFGLQKLLRSSRILTAIRKIMVNERTFIEYPLLNPGKWRTLEPSLFWSHYPDLLVDIFTIIDYLHLFGLVHCDLKFENFQIDISGDKIRIILIDLDFLAKSRTSPALKIFGTPGHIAPEILKNEEVLIESDNYSIGIALDKYLRAFREKACSFSPDQKIEGNNIADLVRDLIAEDPVQRPPSLIAAIYKHGIIDRGSFDAAQKNLLAMKLLTDFGKIRSRARHHPDDAQKIISSRNGIFGLPLELIELLTAEMAIHPYQSFRHFKTLLAASAVERFGDSWHLNVPDESTWSVLSNMEVMDGNFGRAARMLPDGGQEIDRSIIESILSSREDDRPYLSFLALKSAYLLIKNSGREEFGNLRYQIEKKLAALSKKLGRNREEEEFLVSAIAHCPADSTEKIQLFYEQSQMQLLLGKTDSFLRTVSAGKALCERLGDMKFYRIFQRQEAWLSIARGEIETTDALLSQLLEKALDDGWYAEASKVLSTRVAILHRQGQIPAAIDMLNKALTYAKKQGEAADLVILYSNLAVFHFQTGSYTLSIKCGKQAAELANKIGRYHAHLSALYLNLMISYSRLADYEQADYWLNKYLNGKIMGLDRKFFQNYGIYHGNLLLKRGQLREARDLFFQFLSLHSGEESDRDQGKLYQNIVLLSLYTGNSGQFEDFIFRARKVFNSIKDSTSLLELDFLETIRDIYAKTASDLEGLEDFCDRFIVGRNHINAALCQFYIMLYGGESAKKRVLSDADRYSFMSNEPKVPIFRAVLELIEAENSKNRENNEFLVHLKTAYRVLNNSGDRYNSLLLCFRIGEIYKELGLDKLARKFLQQAHLEAQRIGHTALNEIIERILQDMPDRADNQYHLVNSLKHISEILYSIEDRDLSLSKLVRYAVDETGAERGVLLMRADPQAELKVKVVVNCDDNCLEDIRQFSNSIVNTVAVQQTPLIIDNALSDDRTRRFKSIVSYNILSVICVPIRQDNILKGVLYLDHHTIPALFESEDITFIHAIANFISVLLRTVNAYGQHLFHNRQLTEDFQKLGGSQFFITQNASMHRLFSKFPEIAGSNASILLVGASGTGKEILAQMIHEQSLRASGPLIKLNCAAISASLIESELFGVAKNAATGVDERDGKLWAADGGTLFFDEIGDMPLEIQSKILRVIEYQRFEKVGSNRTLSTDIRFLYATNKNLKELIGQGKFREDLFYRINTITINVPALSERADDIPLLLDHFSMLFSPDERKRPIFSDSCIDALGSYSWPGNVRELRNFVEKCCIYYPGKNIDCDDLPAEIREKSRLAVADPDKAALIERRKIREMLRLCRWNQSETARRLNIPLSTLRRKIKKYRIDKDLP
ncbi:hypothetical protein TRIP_C10070 [Candidatus Zixiibacteriota bacterium]|nr:hypothetical protein TRIP_C10070 [candidate division Zixibacteria bacterium]